MYGQTEATARMAYLPPHLAEERPDAIGIPVPGGSFRIDTDGVGGEAGVGELVYGGPNVMLGYATSAEDLAGGRETVELRTGDLARQHEDGIYEVVGRRSRFAKVYGLRIDLDQVERLAAEAGVRARAVQGDGALAVFVTRHFDLDKVTAVAARCGLPRHAIRCHVVHEFPTTTTAKPDYAALGRHAALLARQADRERPSGAPATAAEVRDVYAELLGRPDAGEGDSFVGLRGDSLSYVEASIRLEDLLGTLPPEWPSRSAADLACSSALDHSDPSRRRGSRVRMETSVVLRAVAIVLVVATHANLITVMGGAHLMLAVAGFNLARFQLCDQPRTDRVRSLLRAAGQIALPACIWILGVGLLSGMYEPSTALMLNSLLGSATWDVQWQFWFLEAVVWSQVAIAGLVLVPVLDKLERQQPYVFALAVVVATVAGRYLLVGVGAGTTERYALPVVLWCIALGWLVARSDSARRRLGTSVLAAASTYGFFDDPVRETLVVTGLLLLVWVPLVRVPRALAPALAVVAASSLFVYLTHWQVYPHLEVDHPLAATLSSFAVGIAVWKLYALRSVARSALVRTVEAWPAVRSRQSSRS